MVVEVRKKKDAGACYPPNTLYQLCCGLLRFLRNNGSPELNIFTDPSFKHFQDCLDAEMKRLTRIGLGSVIKQAESFSEEQENKLWELGLLGDHSAKALIDTMVFLVGKHFALRSGKEHRSLRFSQFAVVNATNYEPEKLIYTSFGEKNNPGGLQHRRIEQKKIEHYANEKARERCLVNLYKIYVARCSAAGIAKDTFYLSPRKGYKTSDKEWFGSVPVGHNKLGDTVRRLCKEGGIEGQFTNHSLRATTATRGLEKGIPDKYLMERTGHRDYRSLQKYQRPSTATKIGISRAFEGEEYSEGVRKQRNSVDNVNFVKPSEKRTNDELVSEDKDMPNKLVKMGKETLSETRGNGPVFKNCTFEIRGNFSL